MKDDRNGLPRNLITCTCARVRAHTYMSGENDNFCHCLNNILVNFSINVGRLTKVPYISKGEVNQNWRLLNQ